ncbi:MAG TPA: translation elongation factor 4 [Candidatus Tyrphobacter sp.]|nr:translation elongation factor 4 [Candidatus Tyrphobacter sp.]
MIDPNRVRNFVIIAHIDHGKSTLADRFLEITRTVLPQKMKAQYLDRMDLERERGITIKMAPVKMTYFPPRGGEYILNLIDTPGHQDFAYEVSRALAAVEGAILLVDATQGIQAQTLANFLKAKEADLVLIGAVNKIDAASEEEVKKTIDELAELLDIDRAGVYKVSGKTGEGVSLLLEAVIQKIPPPKIETEEAALIFDSLYDEHKGIIAFVRVFGGKFEKGQSAKTMSNGREFKLKDVGIFSPEFNPAPKLEAPLIGYLATGLKNPEWIRVGDTIGRVSLPGFRLPQPVVFVSVYPENQDDYDNLKAAVAKLRLADSALSFGPDLNEALGRGFRGGFLGKLHFEIFIERLKKEFGLEVVSTFPSVAYKIKLKEGEKIIDSASDFPDDTLSVLEPMVALTILTPQAYLGGVLGLKNKFRLDNIQTDVAASVTTIKADLPLGDLILDFDDELKSVSQGYASFTYELTGYAPMEARKLEILVAGDLVPGLTRIVPKEEAESIGRKTAKRLKDLLPAKQFVQAIQAVSNGQIIARETIPALRKDVTGYLYGGDRSRKMKLWQKQKAGKKRLKASGRVTISASVFKEILKK